MMEAVNALIAPGVLLMNRLRYPRKFALISALFAIPLGLMMYLWLTEIGERVAFAEKERRGLEYVVALRRLLEPLERSRGLALLAARGDTSAPGQLAEERARITAAARMIDVVDGRSGAELADRGAMADPAPIGGDAGRAAGRARSPRRSG